MGYIGSIEIPEIPVTSEAFPIAPDFPWGRAHAPEIVVHRMGPGSANGKVEQRFYVGPGAKAFTVRRKVLTPSMREDLEDFWQALQGPYGAFTYNAPNDDNSGTTPVTCRFRDRELTLEYLTSCLCSVGVELVEHVTANPEYTLNSTANRFPGDALEEALLAPVQRIIPLLKITPRAATWSGDPAVYLSDRRCIVGGQQYEARLLDFDGIEQGMGGQADSAEFVLGNADRVMTAFVNDCNLTRATIQFSLFHVGAGIKLDLWAGEVRDWKAAAASELFHLYASDGFFELRQDYPRRKICRACGKQYNNAANGCDWVSRSGQVVSERTLAQADGTTRQYTFDPDEYSCDKSWDGPNGCLAHLMEDRFGGIVAKVQTVRTKDNSRGTWGFGRPTLTSASMIAESVYNEVVPEIYCKITNPDASIGFPVNAKIAEGRDEGDFYAALGVVGEGPIAEFANPNQSTGFNPHKLDGQDFHGWVSPQRNTYGLRLGDITGQPGCHGQDPVPAGAANNFSLGEGGEGVQRYGPERAAGTAFAEIRRMDPKGLQLSRVEEHQMQVSVRQGLGGFTWAEESGGTFVRSTVTGGLNNPIWIAANIVIKARGLQFASDAEQQALFDMPALCQAAAICDEEVQKLIGTGTETQFTFTGVLQDQKPLREWLEEVLNTCLGYYTFASGKLKIGVRCNSSAVEQWSDGNIVWGSLAYEPLKPTFNHLTGQFADEEFGYVGNTVSLYDETHAKLIGGESSPLYLKAQIAFVGAAGKSQVARLVTTRLRENLGGYRSETWKYSRYIRFKTTLLGLTTEPGMVSRIDHEDMPDLPASAPGSADPQEARPHCVEFRCQRWRLNKDFSIDVEGPSTHNEIYDLTAGPKPADVDAIPLPEEEQFPPANWRFGAYTTRDGKLRLYRIAVGTNGDAVHRGLFEIYYIPEARNTFGDSIVDMDLDDTSVTMSGAPPVDGAWIMIDNEVMYVEQYEPESGDTNWGMATVRRGQLGTKAATHTRITTTIRAIDADNACRLWVDAGLELRPGCSLVVDDGGGPPYDQKIIASYDATTGETFTTLPFTTADVGDSVYHDPRVWRVERIVAEVPFQPRFFRSPNRAKWEHVIDLPRVGVVVIKGTLQNTRGISSDPVYVFPVSPDAMAPQVVGTYIPNWPHRIRTLGGHRFQFQAAALEAGLSTDVFQAVRTAEAQPFQEAYADVSGSDAGSPIAAPPGLTAIVPTKLRPYGTIALGGAIDDDSAIHVRITGENEISVQVWLQRDAGASDLAGAASSLADWLNGDPHFSAYYMAEASGTTVEITDRTGGGGTLEADTAGDITATATGFSSALGVLTGRKYAIAFRAGSYLSALSPLSDSTGPTGGAQRVELQDIPVPGDERVAEVWVYATPDGADSPLYRVAAVPAGTTFAIDQTTESELAGLPPYPGEIQPAQAGDVEITLYKNGSEWFRLYVRSDQARSNVVHGFAMDPLEENAEITADVDNAAGAVDLTVILQ